MLHPNELHQIPFTECIVSSRDNLQGKATKPEWQVVCKHATSCCMRYQTKLKNGFTKDSRLIAKAAFKLQIQGFTRHAFFSWTGSVFAVFGDPEVPRLGNLIWQVTFSRDRRPTRRISSFKLNWFYQWYSWQNRRVWSSLPSMHFIDRQNGHKNASTSSRSQRPSD